MDKKQRFNFLIIAAFSLALFLRLININQSLWLDEAISAQAAVKFSFSELLFDFLPSDVHPPLYQLILHFWCKVLPYNEFFLRLPSIIFSLLTCCFIYKIYQLIFKDKQGAFFCFLFLLTSPLFIYYAQEARMYSLSAFLVTASVYYLIKFFKIKKIKFLILNSAFLILSFYSHYLCWLILPVQWLFFLIQKNKNKRIILNYLIIQFLSYFFYLPWFPVLFNQWKIGQQAALTNKVWAQTVGGLTFKSLALLPIKFIIGRTSFDNKLVYGFIVSGLLIFFAYLFWRTLKNINNQFIRFFWLWLILAPLLGAIISLKTPVFTYHRFLFCLPAFSLLLSRGILSFKSRKVVNIMAGLVLLINLFFSFRYLLNPNFHRENWKEAVKILHQKNKEEAPVLILQNVTAPFDYYDQGRSHKVYLYQKEAIGGVDSVWLIPYALPIFDPLDETRAFLESRGFVRVYEEHFSGVTLEKWGKILAKN